nr:MAG TPA: hypothetical protein [Bacteriophage sp.]
MNALHGIPVEVISQTEISTKALTDVFVWP